MKISTGSFFYFSPVCGIRAMLAGLVLVSLPTATSAAPTTDMALKLKPVQSNVQYDRPETATVAKCTINVAKQDGEVGWVVRDPNGQILRRFVDSNKDNVVDRWCYYFQGVEVYRDIDSDFNRKADQHRWLNTAGRRWGVDKNEDGKIDSWKAISAQEVTAELVSAVSQRDTAAFGRLLLTKSELVALGLGSSVAEQVKQRIDQAEAKFRRLVATQRAVTKDSQWVHFSAAQPGVVPAGTEGSTKDLVVYENVVAMTDNSGKQGLVHVGTMIQVGDVWKLIDAPTVSSTSTTETSGAGFFFQVATSNRPESGGGAGAASNGVSQRLQKLLNELEEVQKRLTKAAPDDRLALHKRQATALEQLFEMSTDAEQRETWAKQLADTISAAVQTGEYPTGTEKLDAITKRLAGQPADKKLAAYVRFRRMMAAYSLAMQAPKADYAKIQSDWLKDLEKFVGDYPSTEDTAEAMLQLAMASEFAGEEAAAKKWYGKIVTSFSRAPQARKAEGARRRLDSVGKILPMQGRTTSGKTANLTQYRGRVVVIQFWATWCEPCKAEMEELRKLVGKYGKRGFSVLGINVDTDQGALTAFLRKNRLPWVNIHESGGMESRPAQQLGILTLPTMLLVDQRNTVVNRSIHVSELEAELKKRLTATARSTAPARRK